MAKFRQARRFGRDEDLESAISALKDDPDADAGDVLAAVIADCDPDQIVELTSALRDIVASLERGGDLARWGEDRRFLADARRKDGRDGRRKIGRDEPEPFTGGGRPRPGGEMDPIEGEDRRRGLAGDRMAYDRLPSGLRLPRVERC